MSKHMFSHLEDRVGATVAGHMLVEHTERAIRSPHPPLPLVIALQFWAGDQAEALQLAKFLADLEPTSRDDVLLAFCRRFDVPMSAELHEAGMYCGEKFPITHIRSERVATGHPDGCFGLWYGTAEILYRHYCAGWPYGSAFFVEADGVPTRFDWLDYLKRAHMSNLQQGKSVTGAWEGPGRFHEAHVNGTVCIDLSMISNYPSLQFCREGSAWDCFHSGVFLKELGRWEAIENLYGAHDVTLSVYKTIARKRAWLASVKDGSAWNCAQTLLDPRVRINTEGAGI